MDDRRRLALGLLVLAAGLAACATANGGAAAEPVVLAPAPPIETASVETAPVETAPPPPAPTVVPPPMRFFHGTVTVHHAAAVVAVDEPRLLSQAFDAEGALRRCYETDMQTAGMYASEITFRLAFAWDGTVLGADRDPASPLPAGPVVDCMASELRKLVVPPKGGTGRAMLLFVLQPRS